MWGHQFHIFTEGRQMTGAQLSVRQIWATRKGRTYRTSELWNMRACNQGGLWNRLLRDLKPEETSICLRRSNKRLSSQQWVEAVKSIAICLCPQTHVSLSLQGQFDRCWPKRCHLIPQKGWPTDLGIEVHITAGASNEDSQASLPNSQCHGVL